MCAWVEMRPGREHPVSSVDGLVDPALERGPGAHVDDPVALEDDRAVPEEAVTATVEGDHVARVDQDSARRAHERFPSPKSAQLASLGPVDPGDGVEVGSAQEVEHGVGDRPELLRDVVLVVGRRGRLARPARARRGHDVGDDAPRPAGLLARRLHVRRRGLRVGLERLPDRLPVDQLVVEPAGAELGDEVADEVLDRLGRGSTRSSSSRWKRRATALQSRRTASRPTISSVSRRRRPPAPRSASCCPSRRRAPRA